MKKEMAGCLFVFLFSCSNQSILPSEGMYVRMSAGEYSRAYDTLVVFEADRNNNSCLVHRKTGYVRIVEGKEQPRQWKSETMLTFYDPKTGQLTDRKTGRIILFRKKELLFGTAVYRKQ